jgi:sn-glycerol 3-phosphate transport system ATP-binding protein
MTIDLVEALGADTLVHGNVGTGNAPVTVRLPGNTSLTTGQRLSLSASPESFHLFDGSSGARLN